VEEEKPHLSSQAAFRTPRASQTIDHCAGWIGRFAGLRGYVNRCHD